MNESKSNINIKENVSAIMEKINKYNHEYSVLQKDGKKIVINDFDCMRLGKDMKAIWKNPKMCKQGYLESLDMVINYYSSVIVKDCKVKPL